MSAPFEVGDVVVCISEKPGYLKKGKEYTISRVFKSGNGYFVTVVGCDSSQFSPNRFELASGYKTRVERKIKQMEQRFIKHQQEKKNESMCCL